jgi:hypothetical protein
MNFIFTYTYLCMFIFLCIYIFIYIYIYKFLYIGWCVPYEFNDGDLKAYIHIYVNMYIYVYIYVCIYIFMYIHIYIYMHIYYVYIGWCVPYEFNDGDLNATIMFLEKHLEQSSLSWSTLQVSIFLYFFMGGLFWLFIVWLFYYICIFYYLYVDSFTSAFGWSTFLCRIRFCDTPRCNLL